MKEYKEIEKARKIRTGRKVNWRTPSVATGIWLLVLVLIIRTIIDNQETIQTLIGAL